ncbi:MULTISPECIES: hypothetical protein [Dethiosulfovibrio]|uniref:Uncharacterized protein n=2 Tax=Dethiosulfovibrio TaxID=47054 RepID=A0ABS9ER27_9BACT|nr:MULTISPECIES: hypothetical protein [Dethiosulfovibrio]MCF4115191.1 hypothetical protein [Dethiosulfovibrio russensis]MCF4143654.1 hypothetical protein [Dethiosulfovibrio marinus]MCF4146111.1 hypothetical protein [Dethiosulfovibrio acidaminovorans]
MRINQNPPVKVPQTDEDLLEELKKAKKNIHKANIDMVDIHQKTVKEGQERRKAFYEMKDLKKKSDKAKEKRKELAEEDLEIKRQRQKFFTERRMERESKWKRMTSTNP